MTNNISFWVEKNAAFTPKKVAINFEGDAFTYLDFAIKISHHARTLKHTYGVGRGDRVAYLGMNHPDDSFPNMQLCLLCPRHRYVLKFSHDG